MALNVMGMVERFMRSANNNPTELRLTDNVSLAVAEVEARYKELTRAGLRFWGALSTLTGLAPVQAIPTTTATVFLFNGESGPNARSYVVDRLEPLCVAGTAAAGLILYGLMSLPTGTLPTQSANYAIVPCNPNSGRRSKAIIATGYTVPTVPSGQAWLPLVANLQAAVVAAGGDSATGLLEGRLIIPPGYGLALAFMSGAGTSPLYGILAQWAEMELDIE